MHLGIEIGGTKLQLGVGAGDGSELAAWKRYDVDPSAKAAGIQQQIQVGVAELTADHSIENVGVGFGGPIDAASGRTIKSHQIEGWEDVPLREQLQQWTESPVVLGNDCDAAALAEAKFGAGRGKGIVFFVTVGTGVGGGLVIDGRLHGAGRPASAEIGHLRPGLTSDKPGATVESMASGWGIAATARRIMTETRGAAPGAKDLLARCDGDADKLTAQQIGEAAKEGNGLARVAVRRGCQALGWAIAQVVTLASAEVIVVGGGVSLIGEEHFFEPLRKEAARYVFPPLSQAYEIVPAALGELVVVHGALALAASGETA